MESCCSEENTNLESLEVLAHFEDKLLGALLAQRQGTLGIVRLWKGEERYGRRGQGEQPADILNKLD